MSQYLYGDFLRDREQYGRAEQFWQELFDRVVRSEGVERDWQVPWLVTRFADGTPFGDGNPIFSAWSPAKGLGVRIIQNELGRPPGDSEAEFDSWLDTFDAEGEPIRERVISCVLSDEVAVRATALIRTWVSRQVQARSEAGPARTG